MLNAIEIHASVVRAMDIYAAKTGKKGLEKSCLRQVLIENGGSEEDLPAALLRGIKLLAPEGVHAELN